MTVKDEGKGMSPETQKRIFEPFYTERSQGIGLGLALVYQMAEYHQAKLDVKSELGKGTDFSVEFKKKGPEEASSRDVSSAA
jgi:two-component system sporulation sensor kinase A